MMALGAIKYLADAGKSNVRVAGFDALAEARSLIGQGVLQATIDQQAAEQGYQGVLYAMRLIRAKHPAETLLNVKLVSAATSESVSNGVAIIRSPAQRFQRLGPGPCVST